MGLVLWVEPRKLYIFCISYISIEGLSGSHMPRMRYRKSSLDVIDTLCFSPFQGSMLG